MKGLTRAPDAIVAPIIGDSMNSDTWLAVSSVSSTMAICFEQPNNAEAIIEDDAFQTLARALNE